MADPTISNQQQMPHGDIPASSSNRNPADNLSQGDRKRGGVHSAALQNRDQRGKFSGQKRSRDEGHGRDEGEPRNE